MDIFRYKLSGQIVFRHYRRTQDKIFDFLKGYGEVWKAKSTPSVALQMSIQWINRYPLDNSIGLGGTCPMDSD